MISDEEFVRRIESQVNDDCDKCDMSGDIIYLVEARENHESDFRHLRKHSHKYSK